MNESLWTAGVSMMSEPLWMAAGVGFIAGSILLVGLISRGKKKPQLQFTADAAAPYCRKIRLSQRHGDETPADGYSISVMVKNRSRIFSHKNMGVLASKIFREGEDGTFQTVAEFQPVNLIWSHSFRPFTDIAPRAELFFSLGRILDPRSTTVFAGKSGYGGDFACLSLATELERSGEPHIIQPGNYRLFCTIGGSNTSSITFSIRFFISGQWHADEEAMYREGFSIEVISDEKPDETAPVAA